MPRLHPQHWHSSGRPYIQPRAAIGPAVAPGRTYRRPVLSLPDFQSRRAVLGTLSVAPLLTASAALDGAPVDGSSTAGDRTIRPEQFGAVGDGVSDDSAAIQRAFDALARHRRAGVVILQPAIAYRCDRGLVLDCTYVSLWGQGVLDFARCSETCLRIDASSTARPGTPANNYGQRGSISGQLQLRGGGAGKTAIGLLFRSGTVAASAQMLVENMSVSGCTTGVVMGSRAYNNVFVKCDIFDCGTCIEVRAEEDNGERTTLFGCTLYNSATAVRIMNPAAALYLESCSLDYTQTVYDVERGAVFATDCHHEGDRWSTRPFRSAGDGGMLQISGGIIVGQGDPLPTDALFDVGEHACARVDGTFVHNLVLKDAGTPMARWASGQGNFRIANSRSYDLSRLPLRLHDSRTSLADPNFTAPDWQDPVWRITDGDRLTNRYGQDGDPLVLRRSGSPAAGALNVIKAAGAGSPARIALMCLPVPPGVQVLSGFQVQASPRRPGRQPPIAIVPTWAKIDGHDANRIPVLTRLDAVGVLQITPDAGRYMPCSPMNAQRQRTCPDWATHFIMVVDLTQAGDAHLLFTGLWADMI